MKITIDTINKTVELLGECTLSELNDLLADLNLTEFKIIVVDKPTILPWFPDVLPHIQPYYYDHYKITCKV